MAMALALGGILLDLTGFDVALGGDQAMRTLTLMRAADAFLPALTSLVAIWAVWSYPLTEETAHDVRQQLEARRGAGGSETGSA
jgi:GPH family glycoside/pentoside/hexuronide:cation symporter